MTHQISQIRNLAIAGHGGTGKTTLTEHLLFAGGAISRPETVESGKTVSDFTDEEVLHRMSIHASLSHILWKDHLINLVDTPGAGDFAGEVVAAFRTCESTVLLVDAEAGVQIETVKLWRRLDERNKPRMIFINRMDRPHADFAKVLSDLESKFSARFVPVTLPYRENGSYAGLIDLIHMQAFRHNGVGTREVAVPIPAHMEAEAREAHAALIDAAAEGDDELTEKFLDGKEFTIDDAARGLSEDLADHKAVPVFCGSALQGSGISAFLDFLNRCAPSPEGLCDWVVDQSGKESEQPITVNAPFSAFSFKTCLDPFAGKLSYLKVMTGELRPDMEVLNIREGKKERIGKLYRAQGKKLEETEVLQAGDLGVAGKISSAHTNDTFCDPSSPRIFRPLRLPVPVHHLALRGASKKEEDKAAEILARMTEEDRTLHLEFREDTRETVLSGMGEMHLALALERLSKTARIQLETSVPRIAFRETISRPAEAEFTHKKQTGGHGQYARVVMRFRPLERGEGFRFASEIHGGSVSKNYLPGVEKGILDAMREGFLAGFPLVDMEAVIMDGKEHAVDSSDMAFQLAARGALKEALPKAGVQILEPVVTLRVFVEESHMGDVLSDLSSRRGRVLGQNPLGRNLVEVDAEVPQSELLTYAVDLKSMTSGTGSFDMAFARMALAPGRMADTLAGARNS